MVITDFDIIPRLRMPGAISSLSHMPSWRVKVKGKAVPVTGRDGP
jgi:hypothetical protein